ncbi:MAG: fibrobacter succinogenes major paralogous domain-containing protein, partial [Candidatus Magasanikbacteria bacterium]
YYTNPSRTATMFLTQTNWGGGASTTLSASHSSDQTGWNKFYSTSSADVNTSVAGEVSLSPSLNSTSQTSNTDFNTWATSSVFVSSTGSSGRIVLLKPVGATCNQASECGSAYCTGGLCAPPPPCFGSNWSVSYSGQTYNLVLIGTQCWFSQNLNVGTMLASVSTLPSNNSIIEKWCNNNSTANCTTYGGLYTWAEANQLATTCNTGSCTPSSPSQGICPSGWHIPTDTEFQTLEIYLGMCSGAGAGCAGATGLRGTNQGTQLKSGGTSGFNLLFGAGRYTIDTFGSPGTNGLFWSATQYDASNGWPRYVLSSETGVRRYQYYKADGFSVRCLAN